MLFIESNKFTILPINMHHNVRGDQTKKIVDNRKFNFCLSLFNLITYSKVWKERGKEILTLINIFKSELVESFV